MKKNQVSILALALLLVLGAPLYAQDNEAPNLVAADHQATAASYEQKAAQQEALITEHQQMKKDYKKRFFINEKVTPMDKIQKMDRHCDTIIENATSLKNELFEFATWHKMRAAELQGQ